MCEPRFEEFHCDDMDHSDGDLSAVVRATRPNSGGVLSRANSSSQIHLLKLGQMDIQRHQSMNVKRKVDSSGTGGFNNSGSSSPSSVLQYNTPLALYNGLDLTKCRGGSRDESLADVCQQSLNYSPAPPTPYFSSGGPLSSIDSAPPLKPFSGFSSHNDAASLVERLPETLSRNLQQRDQAQAQAQVQAAQGGQLQRKDSGILQAAADMQSRLRLRSNLMDSAAGRPASAVSQEAINEDFFQGGPSSSSFSQRSSASNQCAQAGGGAADSSSDCHLSGSRQTSPGKDQEHPIHTVTTPAGPVKKIEHSSLSVKLEDSSSMDEQVSPGGTSKGPKRRKNQQKRIVCVPVAASGRPTSEGLPSDLWAWRKYGQKPIKGSPFPRGYYRCSSSKGCSARKQVERSRTEPSMLIITYTAEHNHPWPSHRNALAGSSRNGSGDNKADKSSSPPQPQGPGQSKSSMEGSPEAAAAAATSAKTVEIGDEATLSAGVPSSAAHSAVNSPESAGVETGSDEQVPAVSPEGGIEALVADSSDPFLLHRQLELSTTSGSSHMEEETILDDPGSSPRLLTTRSSMSSSIQTDEDFFADLGELPESLGIIMFGRSGLLEDRSEDESCGAAQMGMDVDPYDLFCWSSASSSLHLESNAVM